MGGLEALSTLLHPSPLSVALGTPSWSPGDDAQSRSPARPLGRQPARGGQRWVLSSVPPSIFPPLAFLRQGSGDSGFVHPLGSSTPAVTLRVVGRAASHPAARAWGRLHQVGVTGCAMRWRGPSGSVFARRTPALPESSSIFLSFNPRFCYGLAHILNYLQSFCIACRVQPELHPNKPLFVPDRRDMDR